MTPQQFIAKWQKANLSERGACQQHFLDLCELLDQPKPAEADPEGEWYTFEKGVKKTDGGDGWADVWMRGHFGWEYKGKHKDLKAAYSQLLLYREDLENPPLLVVCDMDRFEVHTNFTATAKRKYEFDLAGLANRPTSKSFASCSPIPEALRPGITSEAVTVEAAGRFAELADGMRQKSVEPLRAAHFLMKLMFCMFGEDVGLLPAGLFSRLLDDGKANPASLNRRLENLFAAMAKGGDFGPVEIPWFNGGLFADSEVDPHDRPGNQHPGQHQQVRLGQRRTVDLRHALPADPRSEHALANRRPLYQPQRHRDFAQTRALGAAQARMGGGQAEMRGRAMA